MNVGERLSFWQICLETTTVCALALALLTCRGNNCCCKETLPHASADLNPGDTMSEVPLNVNYILTLSVVRPCSRRASTYDSYSLQSPNATVIFERHSLAARPCHGWRSDHSAAACCGRVRRKPVSDTFTRTTTYERFAWWSLFVEITPHHWKRRHSEDCAFPCDPTQICI